MNSFGTERNRQIIPRWLPVEDTCALIPDGAINRSWMKRIVSPQASLSKRRDWQSNQSLGYALDFVVSSYIAGDGADEEARKAARLILREREVVGEPLAGLVAVVQQRASEPFIPADSAEIRSIRARIRAARQRIVDCCRNALAYLDLAYWYTLVNETDKAGRCIETALWLAPENPVVLRGAARFYLHSDSDPERSVRLLRRSPATRRDPQLMAAEIAISEACELRSPLRKTGVDGLFGFDMHPWRLAELAGTVGTLEAKGGSLKRSKKALALAAREPDENTLAQLDWLSSVMRISLPVVPTRMAAASFEAETFRQLEEGRFRESLVAAQCWAAFQPFAEKPAVTASFLASVALLDYETTIRIVRRGLRASPESFVLNNNMAFALASSGCPREAADALKKARVVGLKAPDRAVLEATSGLIAFRQGDTPLGRQLYSGAVEQFRVSREPFRMVLAEVFWAREERLVQSQEWKVLADRAREHAKNLGPSEARLVEQVRTASGL